MFTVLSSATVEYGAFLQLSQEQTFYCYKADIFYYILGNKGMDPLRWRNGSQHLSLQIKILLRGQRC